jgi:hypothetical protein
MPNARDYCCKSLFDSSDEALCRTSSHFIEGCVGRCGVVAVFMQGTVILLSEALQRLSARGWC